MPNGFTDFSKPDGTGAFALESFEPGVRVITKNKGNYWKPGRGNFDSVELRYIPDSAARVQALMSGQIDAANRLDAKTVAFVMKAPTVNVVRTKGTGNRFAFVALCDTDPYTSNDIRLALKYGIDRQKIVDTVYKGFATVGNDTTVPPSMKYFAKDIPQRPYDPDKAAFYFKKAGMANAKMELQVSEGAFSGATDAAVLYQEAMKKAGLDLAGQARLGRRLLGQCLAQSRRSARSIGAAARPPTTSSRKPSCRARTGTTRIGGVRISTSSSSTRARNWTKPSARRCMPTRRR